MRALATLSMCAIVLLAFVLRPSGAWAQETKPSSKTSAGPTTQPSTATTAAPTAEEPLHATIIQIKGKARYALIDEKGAPGPWQQAKVGDRLPASTQIRTMLRSRVVLAFGDDTVVAVDSTTKMSIDEFHRAADTKRVNLGLAHGLIRAGVRETTLRSDMTIRSPTATLSKEGTMDFGMEYASGTGQSLGFLNLQGLVNFTNTLTGESRYLGPGQNVAQAMLKWVDALQQQQPTIIDGFGTTGAERNFFLNNGGGLGFLDPGAGSNAFSFIVRHGGGGGQQQQPTNPQTPITPTVPRPRPEGNFGTGGGLLPSYQSR